MAKRKNHSTQPSQYKNQSHALREVRRRLALTQVEISDRLGLKSSQFISNIERGLCGIPTHISRVISKSYGVDPQVFTLAALLDLLEVEHKGESTKMIQRTAADELQRFLLGIRRAS